MSENLFQSRSGKSGGEAWGLGLVFTIVVGFLVVGYNGMQPYDHIHFVVGFLLSGSSLLIGILLGFLFGIPRALQEDSVIKQAEAGNSDVNDNDKRDSIKYRANTNLEQISDWLTKILVGVGLTQLVYLPGSIIRVGEFFGPYLMSDGGGEKIATGMFIYFLIDGFLLGYLWTRIYLGGEFARADSAAVSSVAAKVDAFEQKRQKQSQNDAKALSMTYQWLASPRDVSFSKDELRSVIVQASAPVKVQIFYQAEELRSKSWKKSEEKPKIENTIAIFESLIEADEDNVFHQNYAQLGYALKDKRSPDYKRSADVLSKAISLRGPATESWQAFYELNRAICLIKMDENFIKGVASASVSRKAIQKDLEIVIAAYPNWGKEDILEPDLIKWTDLNPPEAEA